MHGQYRHFDGGEVLDLVGCAGAFGVFAGGLGQFLAHQLVKGELGLGVPEGFSERGFGAAALRRLGGDVLRLGLCAVDLEVYV